jgi:hypothetical protein
MVDGLWPMADVAAGGSRPLARVARWRDSSI